MSKVVWKFPLKPSAEDRGLCEIEMPKDAEVLTVSAATGEPCLWALVSLDAKGDPLPKMKRTFRILGTGHKGPDALCAFPATGQRSYLGTFFIPTDHVGQMLGLPPTMVYHVFDLGWV